MQRAPLILYDQHNPGTRSFLNGTAVLATPGSKVTVDTFQPWDFAFTSCDASDYPGNLNLDTVVTAAIGANVSGILFYSTKSMFCNLTQFDGYNNFPSMTLWSTTSYNDSSDFLKNIETGFRVNKANVYSGPAYMNVKTASSSLLSLGGSGSTAVAMIILYSITGVITALFLVIIVTGAIRAHRHPERYGPRNIIGRPRQSRAKGIARAMLDTLPIVKFGEQRPEGKDVESEGTEDTQSHELASRNGESGHATEPKPPTSEAIAPAVGAITTSQESNGPIAAEGSPASTGETDNNLGCSICTEDFERGQDIRVLPCNHQFHPACVDPWLLDVSGTCPLCRVDLNPQGSATASDELPPPLDPDNNARAPTSRGRATIRAILLRRNGPQDETSEGLQSANPEERLAALRRWRRSREQTAPASSATDGQQQSQPAASSSDAPAASIEDTAEAPQDEVRRRSRLGALSRLVRRR